MGIVIAVCIILLIALLLLLPICVDIKYSDTLSVEAKYFLFKVQIKPQAEHDAELKKYSIKKFKAERAGKKARKKTKGNEEKTEKESLINYKQYSVPELIDIIKDIVIHFSKNFFGALYVKIKTLHVSISSDDAAKTAMLYGAACGAVSGLLNLGKNAIKLKLCDDIWTRADFCTEKSTLNVDISLKIPLIAVLSAAVRALWKIYIKFIYTDKNGEKNKEKGEAQNG